MLPKHVQRFDIHQRLQHGMMATSFILCGFTGWPLRAGETEPSAAIAAIFGGPLACRMVHRGAGVLMILSLFYHIGYLATNAARRRLSLEMLPKISDVVEVYQNLTYLLGIRKEVPDFGRWTYIEKFDYFAGAWGKFVMGTTGLILWFPVEASRWVPGIALQLAVLVHGREALIALLAIFVFHMYNVHIRPGVFPMSRVWLDGNITMEELQHHHPREFRQKFPGAASGHGDEEGAA